MAFCFSVSFDAEKKPETQIEIHHQRNKTF